MATRKTKTKTDLQKRLGLLKSEGMEQDKDYIIHEYSHGYIDLRLRWTREVFEYRPDESEIVRDPYGVEEA